MVGALGSIIFGAGVVIATYRGELEWLGLSVVGIFFLFIATFVDAPKKSPNY